MTRIKTLLLAAFACLWLQSTAHAQGLAMALDRSGEVEASAGGKTGRLNVLDYLPADAELRLPAGATATLVYLPSSQEWQFAGPGRYRLQPGQPLVLQGAPPRARGLPAPSSQAIAKLEPAQRERMAMGAVVMRSSGPLRIVSPNNVDLLDARPTLLWTAAKNQPVRISVSPADSQNVAADTVTTASQWTLPAELPAGDYSWRAEIVSDTPGVPRSGRFHVIDSADPRRAALAGKPVEFSQRVALAMTLESEKLPHDALLLWRELAAERPEEESLKLWAR